MPALGGPSSTVFHSVSVKSDLPVIDGSFRSSPHE
jgi:hypothetical protein